MASSGDGRFDDVFMTMAQQSGSIDGLLRTFFSFLHRRTDFYVVQPPEGARMGFPEGRAEEMVRCSALPAQRGSLTGRRDSFCALSAPSRRSGTC